MNECAICSAILSPENQGKLCATCDKRLAKVADQVA